MPIEFVRIDDRLIHGQVVTTWVKQKKIEQILIINDDIAKDEVQKSVFDLMAPSGVLVKTFAVEKFADIFKKTVIKRRTMLLLTSPSDVLVLVKNGVDIDALNLGGMKYTNERKRYTKAVSLSENEKASLKEMDALGVEISVQMIPSDKKISYADLKKMEGVDN
ncbi:MAG: PTS sugar transporter subunit IIB [Sporolactobacillus sp.]